MTKKETIIIVAVTIFVFFCINGFTATKVPINRNFAGLSLGMSKEEYKEAGWIFGTTEYAYVGHKHSVRYQAIQLPEILGATVSNSKSLEKKYPDELKGVHAVTCVFFNDKLCQIQIEWYADESVPWDAFSQKAIDKYGKPNESGIDFYVLNDTKTSLTIKKDYRINENSYTTYAYDLNIALYTDNELYLQLKKHQNELAPKL